MVAAFDAAFASDDDEWVRTAFSALSSTVRGNAAMEGEFSREYAARVVSEALGRRSMRVCAKAAFFLKALVMADDLSEELDGKFTFPTAQAVSL